LNQHAWDLLRRVTLEKVADPESDIVAAEEYEGRWAVRMRQGARDFTTVWFEVGDLTVGYEAYVLPSPPRNQGRIYRQLLGRNLRAYRCFFALDRDGDVYLRGRLALTELSPESVDEVLGAVYEMIELSFRSLVQLMGSREKTH
jgi:hypothetical protein